MIIFKLLTTSFILSWYLGRNVRSELFMVYEYLTKIGSICLTPYKSIKNIKYKITHIFGRFGEQKGG